MQSLAIVIPAYKATYLKTTLESIANQTDKRFTLYIGDDCSPNNLKPIVDSYKDKIALVYHRFEENLGGHNLVAHWERCIALTNNEKYIWLFSDDDIMDKNCVKLFNELPEQLKDNNLIHFNTEIINERGHIIRTQQPFPPVLTVSEFYELKKHKIVSYVVEFIFPRKLYIEVNGFQNFDLAWGSDYLTWLKMAVRCNDGIISIENANIYWRKSRENISPNYSHDILCRKIKALIYNAAFIKDLVSKNSSKFSKKAISFDSLKFPLGVIWRNRKTLSINLINDYINLYKSKVGYKVQSELLRWIILIRL